MPGNKSWHTDTHLNILRAYSYRVLAWMHYPFLGSNSTSIYISQETYKYIKPGAMIEENWQRKEPCVVCISFLRDHEINVWIEGAVSYM